MQKKSFKKDYVEAFKLLNNYLKSAYKAYKWLHSPCSVLADKQPIELMLTGKGDKILKLIKFLIKENLSD